MKRILTGIQSSGIPHLGNVLGAILPAVELSQKKNYESFLFIADLHSLSTLKDPKIVKHNTYATAAAWLAFGVNTDKTVFYRQSDISEVTELSWILNCVTPIPMLQNAHSYKDKEHNLSKVNAGVFSYPVLMAADILLYDSDIVPVGKDQIQHIEITRDIANIFNRIYGDTFILPKSYIHDSTKIIPGIDGRKMSKSYGNHINVFADEKELKERIMKILSDSTPLESSKNPKQDITFKLYQMLADEKHTEILKDKYLSGGFGYGNAKKMLFELILSKFKEERFRFNYYLNNPIEIERELERGAKKARAIALPKIKEIRLKTIGKDKL